MRSPSLADYQSAREFFSAVRDASVEAERTRRTIMRMEAREGVRAQGYESGVSDGGERDRMAPTDARMDFEARMAERIDEDYALIDLAVGVLYGSETGKGGLDALMGSAVADCLSFRYVDARPWSEVSALTGYSERQCRRLCEVGLDQVDAYGWSRVLDGVGMAEG